MCVSAACKSDCLSSGFADSTDFLRGVGGKQRDCNLETRTSWGFILTLWHLQFGKWESYRMISFTWSLRLTPPLHSAPLPIICLLLEVRNLKCTSKNSIDTHKSQSPWFNDWVTREESQSFSFAFCLFQVVPGGKKLTAIWDCNWGLSQLLWVPSLRFLRAGTWSRVEGTWSLLSNSSNLVILNEWSLSFFF